MNRRNFLSLLGMVGLGKLAGLRLNVATENMLAPAGTVAGDVLVKDPTTYRYAVYSCDMKVLRGWIDADLVHFNPFHLPL